MPIYVRTLSFSASLKFKPEKDDPKVNAALDELQRQGAKIVDIKVSLGGYFFGGVLATYLITYEAPAPIPSAA